MYIFSFYNFLISIEFYGDITERFFTPNFNFKTEW